MVSYCPLVIFVDCTFFLLAKEGRNQCMEDTTVPGTYTGGNRGWFPGVPPGLPDQLFYTPSRPETMLCACIIWIVLEQLERRRNMFLLFSYVQFLISRRPVKPLFRTKNQYLEISQEYEPVFLNIHVNKIVTCVQQ